MQKIILSLLFFCVLHVLPGQVRDDFLKDAIDDGLFTIPAPDFSLPAGFYTGPLIVTLSAQVQEEIRYTLDGSPPDQQSDVYLNPLVLTTSCVLRSAVFSTGSGKQISPIRTSTYFLDFQTTLPVFSLSTHPGNLFDPDTGMYLAGPNASPVYPYYGANFWQDWERTVNVEFFETSGKQVLNQEALISINGGSVSRTRPMQSLRLNADPIFSQKDFHYSFFPDKRVRHFDMLVLRNSSGDFNKTHFRDGCLHELMIGELDIDLLCYRPCVVFINGNYWGIHNLREKFSKHYLSENYSVNEDNIDLLEEDSTVIHGDYQAFNAMVDFITGNPMQDPLHYDSATRLLDIHSFCDYIIAETFLSNIDWPKNNIKYWRVRESGSKWRYLLMDLDISLGNNGWAPANMDVLGRLMGPYGYQNKHARIFKALLRNQGFREYFINRYADLVNTVFSTQSLKNEVFKAKTRLEPEMPRHFERWFTQNMEGWNQEISDIVIPYVEQRPGFALSQLADTFGLSSCITMSLDVWPPGSAHIHLNSLLNPGLPFTGRYFREVPLNIRVKPLPGFRFHHWERDGLFISGDTLSNLRSLFPSDTRLKAVMVPEDEADPLYLYPNPVNDYFNAGLVMYTEGLLTYTIVNASGSIVWTSLPEQKPEGLVERRISVKEFPAGLYFLEVEHSGFKLIKSFIRK